MFAVFHLGSSFALAQCTTANFRASIEVEAGPSPNDIAAGDFNSDGKTDFAVTNFGTDEVHIVLGIFALPQNLSPGVCKVTIKASGKVSNTGTIRIAP